MTKRKFSGQALLISMSILIGFCFAYVMFDIDFNGSASANGSGAVEGKSIIWLTILRRFKMHLMHSLKMEQLFCIFLRAHTRLARRSLFH
jgi:hypothetical protein